MTTPPTDQSVSRRAALAEVGAGGLGLALALALAARGPSFVCPPSSRCPRVWGTRSRRIDMNHRPLLSGKLALRGLSLPFTLVVVLAGLVPFGHVNLGTAAQDATPVAPTGPSIVGAWQWNSDPARPEEANFAVFHADGTYVEWQPVAGMGVGVWRATGERTVDLVFVFTDTDPAEDVRGPGTATFTFQITLDESGNAFEAVGTIDLRDAGGTPLASVPIKRPATRMTIETNPATGSIQATPLAGTPTS